jgi:hypothetical protein
MRAGTFNLQAKPMTVPKTSRSLLLSLVLGLAAPVAAHADQWQPLRDDPRISNGLTIIAIGEHIHSECPSITARMMRAISFIEGLYHHATALGYSREQIEAYVEDQNEVDRYEGIARAYFAQNGADYDDANSVCRVGRDEIAAGSPIGRLLRGS